jgi:hypothetical protein
MNGSVGVFKFKSAWMRLTITSKDSVAAEIIIVRKIAEVSAV